jgi:twitching motility protein PilT
VTPHPDAPTQLTGWLDATAARGATDLHLSVGRPPTIRLAGRLVPLEGAPALHPSELEQVVAEVLGERAGLLADGGDLDFSFGWRDEARFRGNAFRQRGHLAIALRRIPLRIPTPAELGLPKVLDRFVDTVSGLVIVTGPTGSGKTTTLASLIDQINHRRACHILTLEEPIEYVHRHELAMVNQREVGSDVESFADGLRAALREDPDVLLVGEMRDIESIQATLTIAETGHLVLATLHTNDAAQAIDRIVDVFPADRRPQVQLQLAATLQAVVYQRLLPTVDDEQAAAFEVMLGTPAISNMIREGRTRQLRNAIATGQSDGMQTLEQSLSALVASGRLHHDVAAAASLHPKEVARPVAGR